MIGDKWKTWYCAAAGYWYLDVQNLHGDPEPINVERRWLDAIHKASASWGRETEIRLPDFQAGLYDWRDWNLVLVGWGFAQVSFDLDERELARIHADTAPDRLDAEEQAGRDELAASIRQRYVDSALQERGYKLTDTEVAQLIDDLPADKVEALAVAGEEIEAEQWAESRRVELEMAEGLAETFLETVP